MDKRKFLLDLLKSYQPFDNDEKQHVIQTINFVENSPLCFENENIEGHITGSALVVDRDISQTLITHHTVLDKWFQLGGHCDGHHNPLEVAMREALEESGMKSLSQISGYEGIFDVNVHPIPAHRNIPAHTHYDIRIIVSGDISEPYKVSNESKDLKWVFLDQVHRFNSQPGFLKLIAKAKRLSSIL